MKVEEYGFGYIRVDGEEYRRDIIIMPDRVIPNWWRGQGHRLSIEDLSEIFEYCPEVLVIGTGANGFLKVPNRVRKALLDSGIEVSLSKTDKAVKEFNRLIEEGLRAAAALHLTC